MLLCSVAAEISNWSNEGCVEKPIVWTEIKRKIKKSQKISVAFILDSLFLRVFHRIQMDIYEYSCKFTCQSIDIVKWFYSLFFTFFMFVFTNWMIKSYLLHSVFILTNEYSYPVIIKLLAVSMQAQVMIKRGIKKTRISLFWLFDLKLNWKTLRFLTNY